MTNSNQNSKLITYNIPNIVTVRKYDVDIEKLKIVLKTHKKASGLKNQELADLLRIPETKAAHWFRTDQYFAIPDPEYWLPLKKLLSIDTNEFDDGILTFEKRPGVYEKSYRVYDINGLSPTITTMDDIKILVEQED